MQIVVLTNDTLKQEFIASGLPDETSIIWVTTEKDLIQHVNADAFFDLLFQPTAQRIDILKSCFPKPVFISDLLNHKPVDSAFIRFNGWPTFLQRNILEASCNEESERLKAEKIIISLNRKAEWTKDIPGFVSARVLAMIINEAYFALEEEVSSKKDIDIALKMGTNYPYGPFEWSEKIGIKDIYMLLVELSKSSNRYDPAPLLKKEALA